MVVAGLASMRVVGMGNGNVGDEPPIARHPNKRKGRNADE